MEERPGAGQILLNQTRENVVFRNSTSSGLCCACMCVCVCVRACVHVIRECTV